METKTLQVLTRAEPRVTFKRDLGNVKADGAALRRVGQKNPWLLYETEVPHRRFCDPARGVSPAETLSPEHLKLLRNAFTRTRAAAQRLDDTRSRKTRRGGDEERGLTLEEFRQVLKTVVGPDVDDTWVQRFFWEVDISCTGQVRWTQLCSYLLLEYTERQHTSIPTAAVLEPQPQIRHCPHNKREPTVRVLAVSHPPPLRYVSVSKGGRVTVWNSGLHVLRSIGLAGDPTEEVANTRRFRGWVTDAVYMGNVQRVAVATDCRDLHFVSVSTGRVFEDVHLFGFHCVPTALCHWHDVQCPERPPLLLLGDEKGGVHLMWFLNPSKGLFKNPSRKHNSPYRIYFPDLSEHSHMVSHRYVPNIHQEPINRLMFDPSSNVIRTSSESNSSSVVFFSVTPKGEPYIWKINQGAKCFDYSASLQLLVTGGCDRVVRLWTRFVTTRPVATLLGHCTTILDVAVYQPVGQIFSYSRDSELRVWDISTHRCLKTVRLHFPCLQPGRIPEHGNFPFLLVGPPLPAEMLPHLVVGCKDYLALFNLARTRRGGGWLMEEDGEFGSEFQNSGALSCALYNPTLRQVVTGHANSSVTLWDVETGRKQLQIANAHGEDELLCMTLDSSHRRLITGAGNGTIKVWNLLSGLNLHKLEPVTNSEVTRLTCLHDNKLLAVGWSQRIVQYDLAEAKDLYVRADMSWKSSGVHKTDILAVCQCSALGVVATASHDGDVIVWRLETQGPQLYLQRDRETTDGSQNEHHILVAPPVDTLLFLQHRARSRQLRNKGVLVSLQGGCLCFWSVTGQTRTYGQFYAPEHPGAQVLSLSSDQPKNTILVSGDSTGCLQVWDISNYAMDVQQESAGERPPRLQCWRAHERGVVSVDVLEVDNDRLFVLSASADGSAGLWTKDGDHVRSFGQRVIWKIKDAAENQTETERKQKEDKGDEGRRESDDRGPTDSHTSQAKCSHEDSPTGSAENDHEQPQQPMYLCEDSASLMTPIKTITSDWLRSTLVLQSQEIPPVWIYP